MGSALRKVTIYLPSKRGYSSWGIISIDQDFLLVNVLVLPYDQTTDSIPHMLKDDQSAATKKDLQVIQMDLQAVQKDFRAVQNDLQIVRKDLQVMRESTKKDLREMEGRLVQHFNVVAENLVHDFKGIFKDRLGQHEDRIVRLEQHVGLVV